LGRGNDGEAIGFNPNDGLIYHASGNDTRGDGCVPFDPSVCVEIFESVNPNTLAVTSIAISGDYTPLTDTYLEVSSLTHLSGNILLVTDIDQNLYKITTTGVVTLSVVWIMLPTDLPSSMVLSPLWWRLCCPAAALFK
jgi:hypothetical protein